MAPDFYEEKYNEKVDIWAFGLCVLEMATLEYPYSECENAAQVFKKVSTGQKPAALQRIKDAQVRAFVDLCLEPTVENRPSAFELRQHPFLSDESISDEKNNQPVALYDEPTPTPRKQQTTKTNRPALYEFVVEDELPPNAEETPQSDEVITSQPGHERHASFYDSPQIFCLRGVATDGPIGEPQPVRLVLNPDSGSSSSTAPSGVASDSESGPLSSGASTDTDEPESAAEEADAAPSVLPVASTSGTGSQRAEVLLVSKGDGDTVKFKLKLHVADDWQELEFDFNVTDDTPESVASEMAQAFDLSNEFQADIAKSISERVSEVLMQRKDSGPTKKELAALQAKFEEEMSSLSAKHTVERAGLDEKLAGELEQLACRHQEAVDQLMGLHVEKRTDLKEKQRKETGKARSKSPAAAIALLRKDQANKAMPALLPQQPPGTLTSTTTAEAAVEQGGATTDLAVLPSTMSTTSVHEGEMRQAASDIPPHSSATSGSTQDHAESPPGLLSKRPSSTGAFPRPSAPGTSGPSPLVADSINNDKAKANDALDQLSLKSLELFTTDTKKQDGQLSQTPQTGSSIVASSVAGSSSLSHSLSGLPNPSGHHGSVMPTHSQSTPATVVPAPASTTVLSYAAVSEFGSVGVLEAETAGKQALSSGVVNPIWSVVDPIPNGSGGDSAPGQSNGMPRSSPALME